MELKVTKEKPKEKENIEIQEAKVTKQKPAVKVNKEKPKE